MTTLMPGSTAIRVPKADGFILRSARISRANVITGWSRPSPTAAAMIPGVRCPLAFGRPTTAVVTAAMGTVMVRPLMPVNRSPTCWVSRM
jgi:hypothetical protein